MKTFTKRLIIFLLLLILISIPIDLGISRLLRQDNQRFAGEFNVWNDIYNSNINCDIAIYGSSRAEVGIDPQIFKESLDLTAYNFGMDGHHFWLQYFRHTEYLKCNKKPKQIILSLDVFSLEKRKGLHNYAQFLPYMLWNMDIFKYTNSYEGFNTMDYFIPLFRYSGESNVLKSSIYTLLKRNNEKSRKNGYVERDIPWNSDFEKAKKEKKTMEISLDEEPLKLFKRFIKECKNNEIKLTLIYAPEYIEGQRFVSNRKEIIELYENISKEYNIPFYNYSGNEICFNKKFFYNASHLNKIGAELFTKKLARDLIKAQIR